MGYSSNRFQKKTFEEIFLPWVKIIKQKECLSILHLPKRDQLYRVRQFMNEKPSFNTPSFYDRIQIIPLDLSALLFDDSQDVEEYLANIQVVGKRPIYLILDADKLLSEKKNIIGFFDSLFHIKNASIIYFFQKNICYEKYQKLLSSFTTFYQNTLAFPYYETADCNIFVSFLEQSFCKIPLDLKKLIVKQCGGCYWLIKQTVRHYCKTQNRNEIFSHDDIKTKLQILYGEYEDEEQNVLKKIFLHEQLEKKDAVYLSYLSKVKLIKENRRSYSLTIPLLEMVIKEDIYHQNSIELGDKKNILLNGVPIDLFFSKRERKILNCLIENKNRVISRTQMAKIIWGEQAEHAYTDWALDQMMWRFRNKLNKLHLSEMLQTVKNVGFIFKQYVK